MSKTAQIQPLVDDAIRLCEEIVDDLHKSPVNYNLTGTVLLLSKLTNISRELDKKFGKPPLTVTLNPENSKPCAMSQLMDIEAKHFTDYPVIALGDLPFKDGTIRAIKLLTYDKDKYVTAQCTTTGYTFAVKAGYIYTDCGRLGEVPQIDPDKLFGEDGRFIEEVTHRDFLGNPIKVGDIVVVTPKNYRGLVKAKVVSFAKTQLNLEFSYPWQPKSIIKYRVTTDSVVVVNK